MIGEYLVLFQAYVNTVQNNYWKVVLWFSCLKKKGKSLLLPTIAASSLKPRFEDLLQMELFLDGCQLSQVSLFTL